MIKRMIHLIKRRAMLKGVEKAVKGTLGTKHVFVVDGASCLICDKEIRENDEFIFMIKRQKVICFCSKHLWRADEFMKHEESYANVINGAIKQVRKAVN